MGAVVEGGGSRAGARSVAVVLFTDLVGSTELRSRLGEDAAEGLRRTHDSLVAGAVEANRGRVLKHLGDGVMATFGGASDAVAAAIRIHQVLDRHNRSGPRLEVRIGISAGDVVFEKGDCFGTPVIEAARLCAAARGGQLLLSDVVRLLAGSGGGQQFRAVGALELKGLPAALPSFEVSWQPLPVPPLPLPSLLTAMGRIFVGREEQTSALLRLWKEAAAGERRVALLAGEPGVGKTRLAAELAAFVHEEGAVVLAGRCDEDLGVPYQPFVEALRHFVDHAPELSLGRYGGELARLVPELTGVADLPPPLESDPETERYRLFDAVAAWLAAASVDRPLLFVLDDLQWAAKPTLLLLRHVVRSSDPRRVLVLGTYRDTELDASLGELLADLRREAGVDRFSLTGLDQAGVIAFMEQAAGHELAEEHLALARVIQKETEGNPFFVLEVLRHLAETAAIERREGRWGTGLPVNELGIPEGVREVVGKRLARLSEQTNRVLRAAAVVGAEFEPAVVETAGDVDEEALISALDEATAGGLVLEAAAGRYRFAHALVRGTLYDALSAVRREALHRRAAGAIEAIHADTLDDHLPALAHHWAHVSGSEAGKAITYARKAGDRALAQLAHDEAVVYYQQALEILERVGADDANRLELLTSLGEAQRRAGDVAYRATLLDAAQLAERRGDADALARAALANYRGFRSTTGTVDTERVGALEAALRAADPVDSPSRARLLANLAVELHFSDERRRRHAVSDEALAMARRLGDPLTLAHVVLARCSESHPDTSAERLANTAELLTVVDGIGDPAAIAWTSCWRFIAATELADLEEADPSLVKLVMLADELTQPTLRWVSTYLQVGRVLLAGRLEEADRLAVEARALGLGAGQPDARLFFATQRFQIRFEQGRLGEVIDRTAAILDEESPAATRAVVALAYCELDQRDEARRVFEPLVSRLSDLPVDVGWLYTMATSADVCAQLGDRSTATCLLDLLGPYADHMAGNALVWTGSVSHYLGLLTATVGRFDEAETRFAAAEATHQRIGAPGCLARTRLEWARMLLTRRHAGDADRARDLLGQTLATARELGLANVERRAVELLS